MGFHTLRVKLTVREGGSGWVRLGVTLQDSVMQEEIVDVSDVEIRLELGGGGVLSVGFGCLGWGGGQG